LPFVDLGPRRIKYAVIKGTSRRYTYFRFRNDLTLEVVLPRDRAIDVEKAISERGTWLRRQYERLSKTKHVLTPGSIMYGGEPLKIVYGGPGDALIPDLERQQVVVHTTDPRHLKELVRRWFLKESSAYVVRKAAELAPVVGAKPSRVDVREVGKWGYCTRGGRLSFSWQLIALPERLREYIVMHELTHLLEFNHSTAFKRKLATVCPDFRARERELDLIVPYQRLDLG
jgi:predicted metal-dependent hydrolase